MSRINTAPIADLSRRNWIKLAAIAGASMTAACTLWSHPGTEEPQVPLMLIFDKQQAQTWYALAEAVLPAGGSFPSIEASGVLVRIDEEVHFISEDALSDIHAALRVLEYLPLIYGHVSRFSSLSASQRARVIEQAQNSRFDIPRAVSSSLRVMVQLFYFGSKPAWAAIGYDGPFAGIEENLSEQRLHYARLRKERQA